MQDLSSEWILNGIRQRPTEKKLWFADENTLTVFQQPAQVFPQLTIISNRFDIAALAASFANEVMFNDFDSTRISDASLDSIFYRVSKEKAVVHHLIRAAARLLKPGGYLFLSGEKNEGIKTFIERTATYFQDDARAEKQGQIYVAAIRKNGLNKDAGPDDQQYAQVREMGELAGAPWFSKPGIFGWNKVDTGSELLVQQVNRFYQAHPRPQNLLDLGCGYGYLTLMTSALPLSQRVLTDNNAAALLAAEYNCKARQLAAQVIAADAGDAINETFELILCNPPFHQGFSNDGDLTDKFLRQAARLLHKDGRAFFVVNQFIPLEKKAAAWFGRIRLISAEKGFRVFMLQK